MKKDCNNLKNNSNKLIISNTGGSNKELPV